MTILNIQNASFSRKTRKIFDNFNLAVQKGKLIGLLGPNGTGKSTLLKMMSGILPIEEGAIYLFDMPLQKMKQIERAKYICYMPQTTHLETNFTVEQVVKMGRYPHKKRFGNWTTEDTEAVERAIDFTGIAHLKDRLLPSLSGGERQLVYLTKAIAQDAPVLLLDEPTSDLDIYHQIIVTEVLKKLVADGKTIVAAIHDINLAARICDQCLIIKNGEIIVYSENDIALSEHYLQRGFQVKVHVYEEQFTKSMQMIPYEVEP
ncbi:ABC transporter ATP-binding protein [Solibacillus silvestris]|uniref:ABC transporter ATP-binding protein n=1 Tax=Solibacillus silvestris TaxID=76853 RepID=UPI003F80C4E4